MENRNQRVGLPTHEEAEAIIPVIRSEFGNAGVALKSLGEDPRGGVCASASVPDAKRDALVGALFAHGIAPVAIGADEWGFAVRR